MSKFDKYRVSTKPVSKFDKYRATEGPDLYEEFKNDKLVPYGEYEEIWNRRGHDPVKRASLLDKKRYDRNGVVGDAYVIHDPTWTDRGKELLQGIGSGLSTIPDLASNYVAAPTAFLGSKLAEGASKISLSDHARKFNKKIAADLQTLSNKWYNQDLSKDIKNSDLLKTKNRDNTAGILRSTGEFATDILPASAIGTGAKYIAKTSKAASPILKSSGNKIAKWWREPKLPKIANLLETPLTGKNTAAFAGAGAGHGYINTDTWGDKKSSGGFLYDLIADMPIMMTSASIVGGAYSGLKGLGKLGVNSLKGTKLAPNELSPFRKRLANKINNGDNELDEKFIKAVEGSNIDLNPFNIYKDNKIPFKIARNNASEQIRDILPKMKKTIHDEALGILDKNYVKYDRNNPKSELSHTANLITKALKDQYEIVKLRAANRYAEVDKLASLSDVVRPLNTIKIARELYEKSKLPMKKGSGIGKLNDIAGGLYADTARFHEGLPVKDLINQKRALNQIINSAPAEIGGLKSREITLLGKINKAIDLDLYDNSSISDPEYLKKLILANDYFSKNVVPFKTNSIFKKVNKDLNVEKLLINTLGDRNKTAELDKLLHFTNEGKGKGKGKGKGIDRVTTDAEHKLDVNFVNEAKLNLDWAKRLETEKRLFGDKYPGDFNSHRVLEEIGLSGLTDLFKPNVVKNLKEKIRPFINKHMDLDRKDRRYRSSLSNDNIVQDYPHNKYDVSKYLQHWPTAVGAAVGAQSLGPIGTLIGVGVGGGIKHLYSASVMKAMTDKQFVNELIRLGRLPKVEKDSILSALAKRPVLKTEIIKLLFKKDNEKNN